MSSVNDEQCRKAKDDTSSENPTPSLEGLPVDALSTIMSHCTDFQTLVSLGETSSRMRDTIFKQRFTCQNCKDPIFTSSNLEMEQYCRPFICAICQNKLCGNWVDYSKRHCKPQKCDGCGKVECYSCQQKHMQDSDGYGTENYCQECQEEFEFGMGGC